MNHHELSSLGGKARRDSMTPKQRSDSARNARLAQTFEQRSAAMKKAWETRRSRQKPDKNK